MTTISRKYDVVIIGSGLGSLLCARLLGMEGYKVCVLEKNRQFGGNLQTFARDKRIFDTGVHYLGGLAKGQNLYRIFHYVGLMDKLKLEPMNPEAFDIVSFDGDPNRYKLAQGYDRFANTLIDHFPEEAEAIRTFVTKIKEIADYFSVYNIRPGTENSVETDFFNMGAKDYIASLTTNEALRGVLAGNSFLYAGRAGKTPLYVLAMSIDPYIKSSWRCIDGGSQIAKELIKLIKADGGAVIKYKEVKRFIFRDNLIQFAETQDGERFEANQFISGIHPKVTLQMIEPGKIRKVYANRINRLSNTMAGFGVHLVFHEGTFPYKKNNHYHFRSYDAWKGVDYEEGKWPDSIVITFSASSRSQEWAETLTVMGYMKFEEVAPWANTFNTTSRQQDRGEDYEAFKKRKQNC